MPERAELGHDDCSDEGDDTQTAMLLTQHEWDDLAAVCGHYLMATAWVTTNDRRRRENSTMVERIARERKTCERIVEANR